MNYVKELEAVWTEPPDIDRLNQQVVRKEAVLAAVCNQETPKPESTLKEEIANYNLHYLIFKRPPEMKEITFQEVKREFENKLFNEIKMGQLNCGCDTVQKNNIMELKHLLLNSDSPHGLILLVQAINSFDFLAHLQAHLELVYFIRHTEVIQRSMLNTAEEMHLQAQRRDYNLSRMLKKLSNEFEIVSDYNNDPKTFLSKVLSKAQSVQDKVQEFPELFQGGGQIGTPPIQLEFDEHQIEFKKANEEIINPEVKKVGEDQAYQVVYLENYGCGKTDIGQLRDNMSNLKKQFAETVMEGRFSDIYEELSYKVINEYFMDGGIEGLINKIVKNQIGGIFYNPVENVHYFTHYVKFNVESLVAMPGGMNQIYQRKIINGPSIMTEPTETVPELNDLQLAKFVFATYFALFQSRDEEFAIKESETLCAGNTLGVCEIMLLNTKLLEVDYLIKKSYNICIFFLYHAMYQILHYTTEEQFMYKLDEYTVIGDDGEKQTSYRVLDNVGEQVVFGQVGAEINHFYHYLLGRFMEAAKERGFRNDDLIHDGQALLLELVEDEYNRMLLIQEILKQLWQLLRTCETRHFSIVTIMCTIFRYRDCGQTVLLDQIHDFLVEMVRCQNSDGKQRLRYIQAESAEVQLYEKLFASNNATAIAILLDTLHHGRNYLTHLGYEVDSMCFLSSIIESCRVEMLYISRERQRIDDYQMKVQKMVLSLVGGLLKHNTNTTVQITEHQIVQIAWFNYLSLLVCTTNALVQAVGNLQYQHDGSADTYISLHGQYTATNAYFDHFCTEYQLAMQQYHACATSQFEASEITASTVSIQNSIARVDPSAKSSTTNLASSALPSQQYSDSKLFVQAHDTQAVCSEINFNQLICFKEFGSASFLQTCDFYEKNFSTNQTFEWVVTLLPHFEAQFRAGAECIPLLHHAVDFLHTHVQFITNKLIYTSRTSQNQMSRLEVQISQKIYTEVFAEPTEVVQERVMTIITDNLPEASSGLVKQTFLTQRGGLSSGKIPAVILRLIRLYSAVAIVRSEAEYLDRRSSRLAALRQLRLYKSDQACQEKGDLAEQLLHSQRFYVELSEDNIEVVAIFQRKVLDRQLQQTQDEEERRLISEMQQIVDTFENVTAVYHVLNQLADQLQINREILKAHEADIDGVEYGGDTGPMIEIWPTDMFGGDTINLCDWILFEAKDEETVAAAGAAAPPLDKTTLNPDCQEIITQLQEHIVSSTVNNDGDCVLKEHAKSPRPLCRLAQLCPADCKRLVSLPLHEVHVLAAVLLHISRYFYNIFYLADMIEQSGGVYINGMEELQLFSPEDEGPSTPVTIEPNDLQEQIQTKLRAFQAQLVAVSKVESERTAFVVCFKHVIQALCWDITWLCKELKSCQLLRVSTGSVHDTLPTGPLVCGAMDVLQTRLLSLYISANGLTVEQEFNFAVNQGQIYALQPELGQNGIDSVFDALYAVEEYGIHYRNANINLMHDHVQYHGLESNVNSSQQVGHKDCRSEFLQWYSELLAAHNKQPAAQCTPRLLLKQIERASDEIRTQIRVNLQLSYFRNRPFLLTTKPLQSLLVAGSPAITDIYLLTRRVAELNGRISSALVQKPPPPSFAEVCPAHLTTLYEDVHKLTAGGGQGKDQIELYKFDTFTPGAAGIAKLEEQIANQVGVVEKDQFDFFASKSLKTFFVNLAKSCFRNKESKQCLYVSSFELFKLYSEFVNDVYEEFSNQLNIQLVVSNLNNFVLRQVQKNAVKIASSTRWYKEERQALTTEANYLARKASNELNSFHESQNTDIEHLRHYSRHQLDILSIMVGRIYTEGLEVMITHQSVSEQYIDELKFSYCQAANQIIFQQNIDNLQTLFDRTRIPLFGELIHLENELFNYENLLKIESLLLNREMNFQHIQLNKLEYLIQGNYDVQHSELNRLELLKQSLAQVNDEKEEDLRRELAELQVSLRVLTKDEETLRDEMNAIIKPTKKAPLQGHTGRKQLEPLEALADDETGYQKTCLDVDAIGKQISHVDTELEKCKVIVRQLREDVDSQLAQYQKSTEALSRQLKSLKKARTNEVARVNELEKQEGTISAGGFSSLDAMQQKVKETVADLQNQIYKQRTELIQRQEYLKKLERVVQIYRFEEQKMRGYNVL